MGKGKQPISVTLAADNLTWLKGRAIAGHIRSVSELLDQLITAARASGHVGTAQSVVGTIDIDPNDPMLDHADEVVRRVFERSVGRPLIVRGTAATRRRPSKPQKARRG
jgi:hypothetical protein